LQLVAHLPVCVFRKANAARLADRLQAGRDVDAVSHQIAVGFLDHVAEVDANASLNALVRGDSRVALGDPGLHLDGRSHRLDHAAELDHRTVAGAFDNPPVVNRDSRVDEIAAQSP
jgi:hypothetical protein